MNDHMPATEPLGCTICVESQVNAQSLDGAAPVPGDGEAVALDVQRRDERDNVWINGDGAVAGADAAGLRAQRP